MNPNAAFQMNVKQPVGTGPATTYANGSTITSDMLKPAVNTPFQTPQVTPAYPVSTLNTGTPAPVDNFQMTQPEVQADSMSTKLQQLNERLVGQSAFKAQQETALGIPELQKTQTDLTSQLNAIKNEALAIPLQLQNDAQGRGITQAGLAPIEAGALRNNAIKALSVNSLLEASRGNLTSALDMVDRAVAQQFDPIKEQIAVTQANLDLILKSPAYSLAEKKRAQAQKDAQDAKLADVKIEEENKKTVQALALQALQNGAPAAVVSKIMSSPDLNTAFTNAQGFGQKETVQSIQEYNFAVKNGYKGSYVQYQNEDANRKAVIAKAGVAGLPYQVVTQIDKLSSSFDSSPIVKNYVEVQNKKLSVDSIIQTGIKGPADLALVFEFMKALDPTSVVRESEYANASNSGNIFAGAYTRFNGYLKPGGGFLPTQVRKDFQTLINSKYNVATQQYDNLRKETARKIEIKTGQAGGSEYITDYAQPTTVTSSTPIEGLRSKYNY